MATFNFNSGFYLLLDDGSRLRFEAGRQDVPDAVADHPYLAANGEWVEEAPAPEPAPEEAPQQSEPEPAADEPADDVSEHDALVAQAEALGINVDGRWGVARLKAEIAKVAG